MLSIETSNLSKTYSSKFGKVKVNALSELSLSVEEGIIFGLLGPNGAGKTTLVKLLLGITFPTSGTAKILDDHISNYKIKSKIGYLPENHKYPSYLTAKSVLDFFGKLSGIDSSGFSKKIDELLELVKLTKWKDAKVKSFSKGMMQRLGLAQALINDPKLIFLDEPTDGIDPIGRKEFRDIILQLKGKNKTIFLNSHILSEVELITDRVGILNNGKLIKEGTVSELTARKEEYLISIEGNSIENIFTRFNADLVFGKAKEGSYNIKVANSKELNLLIDHLRNSKVLIKEIVQQKSTLEEMFISLIKQTDNEVKN
jgi:ABC-2 type transport system ATP-binding protein